MAAQTNTLTLAIDSSRAVRGARQFEAATRKASGGAKAAERSVGRLDRRMVRMGKTAASVRGLIGSIFGGIGAVLVARSMIKTIADFEFTMATLRGVTKATESEFQRLTDTARRLGAITRFSATEAAEGLLFLARAGFTTEQSIAAVGATLNLAQAGLLDLGEAADLASNIVKQFNLSASDTERVADALVIVSNRANTNVRQLGEAMKFAGPIAGALGISLEETASAVGALGDAGIQSTMAGTNLRGILIKLINPSSEARKVIADLGLTMDDLDPTANKLSDIFDKLNDANISVAQSAKLFMARNVGASLVLARSTDKMRELEAATAANAGETKNMAKIMDDTVNGAAKNLVSAWQELILQGGDKGLRKTIREIVDTMTGAIRIFVGMEDSITRNGVAAHRLVIVLKGVGVVLAFLIGLKIIGVLWGAVTAIGAITKAVFLMNNAIMGTVVRLLPMIAALLAIPAAIEFGRFAEKNFKMVADTVSILVANFRTSWIVISSSGMGAWITLRKGFDKLVDGIIISWNWVQLQWQKGVQGLRGIWSDFISSVALGLDFIPGLSITTDFQDTLDEALAASLDGSGVEAAEQRLADSLETKLNNIEFVKLGKSLEAVFPALDNRGSFSQFRELAVDMEELKKIGLDDELRRINSALIVLEKGGMITSETVTKLFNDFETLFSGAENRVSKGAGSLQERLNFLEGRTESAFDGVNRKLSLRQQLSINAAKATAALSFEEKLLVGTLAQIEKEFQNGERGGQTFTEFLREDLGGAFDGIVDAARAATAAIDNMWNPSPGEAEKLANAERLAGFLMSKGPLSPFFPAGEQMMREINSNRGTIPGAGGMSDPLFSKDELIEISDLLGKLNESTGETAAEVSAARKSFTNWNDTLDESLAKLEQERANLLGVGDAFRLANIEAMEGNDIAKREIKLLQEKSEKLRQVSAELESIRSQKGLFRELSDSAVEAFGDMVKGTQTFGDAFNAMMLDISNSIFEAAVLDPLKNSLTAALPDLFGAIGLPGIGTSTETTPGGFPNGFTQPTVSNPMPVMVVSGLGGVGGFAGGGGGTGVGFGFTPGQTPGIFDIAGSMGDGFADDGAAAGSIESAVAAGGVSAANSISEGMDNAGGGLLAGLGGVFGGILDGFGGILSGLLGSFSGGGGSGSGIGGLLSGIGSLFLGGGGGGGAGGFAKGGAFDGGRVIPMALGGIVGRPQTIPLAGGDTALIGEAGPEAVMPLTRLSGGRLGVASAGGGGETNVVNTINMTINTPDANSFRKSKTQIANDMRLGLSGSARR